eukprot:TRINITY_DN5507_c0_g1_i1.p1 TRINITY_DN5507_c0_g1~~TRINITY_DN5507_c0_g1_i1.p1  ORF type:complete len:374 (-),score=121.51 TRINITY_DN5507_c0_g1_i1:305-1426(-)
MSDASPSTAAPSERANDAPKEKVATVALVIGMAGSGKTTLMQRLNAHVHQHKIPSYLINLDPAVAKVPFAANIDIRDTVNYKEVMKEFKLGPNGAILTSLNLFATRFDQVLTLIDKRAPDLEYILIDTPGQMEVFTWSASGNIITEAISATLPTVIVYVMDTPRSASPTTFMSNMLYACSILYKTQLPLVIALNKCDVVDPAFVHEWMADFEAFRHAVAAEKDESYMNSLVSSMNLVLEEFYNSLTAVGVSAVTGEGITELFAAIDKAAEDFETGYRQERNRRIEHEKQRKEEEARESMERLKKDLDDDEGDRVVLDMKKDHAGEAVEAVSGQMKTMDVGGDEQRKAGDEGEELDEGEREEYEKLMGLVAKKE